jgi:site-specific DNA-adenine methylase
MKICKAPFPFFGGKSRIAPLVWERFGNVPNYVEPFFGSGAVLLGRPSAPGIETVNDVDCYLSNFWRALQADPEAVARYADWPVNECDLTARHQWLVNQHDFRERMKTDPEFYDAKIAGWWVWGLSAWIGGGWCEIRGEGQRVHRQRPHLGDAGRGVHRATTDDLTAYMTTLANRLRRARVCCGDWSRVVTRAPTEHNGITGVFLDPPYADTAGRDANVYATESLTVAHDVREWAIANGNNPLLRIALCGYEGEHDMPNSWECVWWQANGGMANRSDKRGRENKYRERVWFSPHCLPPRQQQLPLFANDDTLTQELEHESV